MKENLLLLTSQVIGHTEVSETLLKFSESESESEWESESESESQSQSESESVCVCVCVCVCVIINPALDDNAWGLLHWTQYHEHKWNTHFLHKHHCVQLRPFFMNSTMVLYL